MEIDPRLPSAKKAAMGIINDLKALKSGAKTAKEVLPIVSRFGKKLEPLAQEARKYKSAEEFVNSGSPIVNQEIAKIKISSGRTIIYKGEPHEVIKTNSDFTTTISPKTGYIAGNQFAVPTDLVVRKNPKLLSQLTDFYNQAVRGDGIEPPIAKLPTAKAPPDDFRPRGFIEEIKKSPETVQELAQELESRDTLYRAVRKDRKSTR